MIINMTGVICIFCHALAMMNIRNGPHKIWDKQSVNTTKLQLRLSEFGLTGQCTFLHQMSTLSDLVSSVQFVAGCLIRNITSLSVCTAAVSSTTVTDEPSVAQLQRVNWHR